jgi:hypothetical protein
MQTILRAVWEDNDRDTMVENCLTRFDAKAAMEKPVVDFTASRAHDVVYISDDAQAYQDEFALGPRAQLGSFGSTREQVRSKTTLIFMDPIVVTCRPDGEELRLQIEYPTRGETGSPESN